MWRAYNSTGNSAYSDVPARFVQDSNGRFLFNRKRFVRKRENLSDEVP